METELSTAINGWLKGLPLPIPLRAVNASSVACSPQKLIDDFQLAGSLVEAMLWLRIGEIERAHSIVQEGQNDLERYVHGVVHRLEGDFWNAKYWFRQVRDASLSTRIAHVIHQQSMSAESYDELVSLRLVDHQQFYATRFVDTIEELLASKQKNAARMALIRHTSQTEWNALWREVA